MDLGTANTIIICNGKIVVDEPSVVALDRRTDKVLAVGEKARQMHGKTHENIRTIRPLRDGVIADFYAAEQMIRGMIKMINPKSRWFTPSLRMVVCIPSGSTEVELRAVRDSAEHAGGRDVYMIYEPMAAAIGIGIDVEAPEGNMIVDIGGGTTEIAVISLGGIVSNKSIRIAGDDLTADIMEYMRRQHNVKVGERTAEQIKINVGSSLTSLENPPQDFIVHGPNQMRGSGNERLAQVQVWRRQGDGPQWRLVVSTPDVRVWHKQQEGPEWGSVLCLPTLTAPAPSRSAAPPTARPTSPPTSPAAGGRRYACGR